VRRTIPGAREGAFAHRSALVIGGSLGLGRAVALALARAGARVLVTGRRAEPLEELRATAGAHGVELHTWRGDAEKPAAARTALRRAARVVGGPDLLVHAAGEYWEGPLERLTPERWDALVRSNVSSAMLAMAEALPGMRRRRYGRILLFGVAGGDAPRAAPRAHAYRAAKVALLTLARSVAVEEASHGITVNVILPGVIRQGALPRSMALLARKIPAGRPGTAQEVARAALFLLADESGYITGAALPVAGGLLL